MNKTIDVKIRSEPHICEYGCGQEATHQFKNGKWCCSKSTKQCPYSRNKTSENRKGTSHSILSKQKMSKAKKGKPSWNKGKTGIYSIETLKKMSLCKQGKKLTKNHKLNISKSNKGRIVSNGTKRKISRSNIGKVFSIETLKKMSNSTKGQIVTNQTKIKLKLTINRIKERYPIFAKVEEIRYNPDKPGEKEIQAHCKNHKCSNSKEQGGWFTPSYIQLYERIRQIEKSDGNGGSYLYCSQKCKQECPLYGKTINQLIKQDLTDVNNIDNSWYTSQEYQEWRQYIFELDDNKCVYCGKKATIVHHILPQKIHPESALDPENGISVCKNCHYKYGHRDPWCTTGHLSQLICERIIKIKQNKENKHE